MEPRQSKSPNQATDKASQPPPESGESDDGYSLAAEPECLAGQPQQSIVPPHAPMRPNAVQPRGQQFSLIGLLVLFTLASFMLAAGRRMDPRWFAGVVGLMALVLAAFSPVWQRLAAVWQLGWWMLLGLYLMSVGWAVWQGW